MRLRIVFYFFRALRAFGEFNVMNQEMNKDTKFNKKIINPVVKEIKKHKKKYDSTPNNSDLAKLKIQTANIFVRILSAIFGIFLIVCGVFLFIEESFVFSIILLIIGIIAVILGIRGRKRELQYVLETIDIVDGISLVIDAISDIDI